MPGPKFQRLFIFFLYKIGYFCYTCHKQGISKSKKTEKEGEEMAREFKGIGSLIIMDGEKLFLKNTFIKENCTFKDIISIDYKEPSFTNSGIVSVKTSKFDYQFTFTNKNAEKFKELYGLLEDGVASRGNAREGYAAQPQAATNVVNNYQAPPEQKKPKSAFGGLKCPKCKGHNIELLANNKNVKEFQRTGLNLNPLHPLTPFKTKTIRKEKGKKHNEYFCRDCGKRWIGK